MGEDEEVQLLQLAAYTAAAAAAAAAAVAIVTASAARGATECPSAHLPAASGGARGLLRSELGM